MEHVTKSGQELAVGSLVQHLQTFEVYKVESLTTMVATITDRNHPDGKRQIDSPAAVCRHLEEGYVTTLWVGKLEVYEEPEQMFAAASDEENAQAWAEYVASL